MLRRSFVALTLLAGWFGAVATTQAAEPQLAHMVFFTLAAQTDAAQDQLVQACEKYLSGHEGTVYFSAGGRAKDKTRDVNDVKFDVALHIVFKDKVAHDKYQTHERHLEFVAKNAKLWASVRVFDSYISAPVD